jgi:hypothetical protein
MSKLKLVSALALVGAMTSPTVEAAASSTFSTSAPTVVSCGPNHRAVVRHALVRGHRVRRVTCVSTVRSSRVVHRQVHRRSWKKSALVIGGATAAGAGTGALIGGKKGALIGAAAGGAAGTVYEIHKRKRHRRH